MTPHTNVHTNVHTLVFDRLADPADNLLLLYVVNPWGGQVTAISHQPCSQHRIRHRIHHPNGVRNNFSEFGRSIARDIHDPVAAVRELTTIGRSSSYKMVRENLISSAVTFLRDPSVVNSTLEQRVAFLRSKNLTQEEIDVSMARAGAGSPTASPMAPGMQPNYGYQTSQPMAQAPGYAYGAYGSYGSPPVQPRRDWRDFFIMATVATGVSYSLYAIAKRYILPLISPPTPPQLEADKASIDESFSRAFALIDQLAADTAELKQSEAQRTARLDSTIQEVETVVADLKAANLRREAESRILVDEVCRLKELVPKALEGWKESGDSRLEELTAELVSLKKLIANRVGGGGAGSQLSLLGRANYSNFPKDKSVSNDFSEIPAIEKKETGEAPNGVTTDTSTSAPALGVTAPKQENSGPRPIRSFAIPAWQLPPPAGNKNTDKLSEIKQDELGA